MPILFGAVAKGTLVLAKFAACSGNFMDMAQQILIKVPQEDKKFTYSVQNFFFNYIAENKLVYFCVTDMKFPRPKAFEFLNEIKKQYIASFGDIPKSSIPYAAMNQLNSDQFSTVLESEMKVYNDNKPSLPRVKAELDQVKSIMVKNVEMMARRGARLETLMNRTDDLATSTTSFRRTAVQVQRKYWWQNIRMYVIAAVVLIFVVYFGGAAVCGGLKWNDCF